MMPTSVASTTWLPTTVAFSHETVMPSANTGPPSGYGPGRGRCDDEYAGTRLPSVFRVTPPGTISVLFNRRTTFCFSSTVPPPRPRLRGQQQRRAGDDHQHEHRQPGR